MILNTVTLAFTLFFNYFSGTGYFGKTITEASALNQTLITPAGYVFAIWGQLYLFLAAFIGYQ
ncbi:MAG: hypothetical protein P8100_02565 [bacterium]